MKDGSGNEVGRIVQQNMIAKIRFGLQDAKGQDLGSINAENWRAWNFSIQDTKGNEVARITKTWERLAKTLFTTADNYLLEVNGHDLPTRDAAADPGLGATGSRILASQAVLYSMNGDVDLARQIMEEAVSIRAELATTEPDELLELWGVLELIVGDASAAELRLRSVMRARGCPHRPGRCAGPDRSHQRR